MKRIDLWLVQFGLAPSRTKAKELISSGKISVLAAHGGFEVCDTPSREFLDLKTSQIKVKSNNFLKFVSRSGLKLEGALEFLGLDVKNWQCLDVGQSTGGFTDCLLQYGARSVTGVDVGKAQLHEKLRSDSRVSLFEGVNAKDLSQCNSELANETFDFVVADLSFISLTKVLEPILEKIKPQGRGLFLVKPQFEVERKNLNKKGVVGDANLFVKVQNKICRHLESYDITVCNYFESSLSGADGNREFFVYVQK